MAADEQPKGEPVIESDPQQVSPEWMAKVAGARAGEEAVDVQVRWEQGLPWRCDYEEPRVIRDTEDRMIGSMDTGDAALLVVEAVNAGDVDARREVTRLRASLGHYRRRGEMTPSERQHYLDEDYAQSVQPERYYIDTREQPAKALLRELEDALATLERLDGTPEQFHEDVATAVSAFRRDARSWLRR